MSSSRQKYLLFFLFALAVIGAVVFRKKDEATAALPPTATATPASTSVPPRVFEIIQVEDGPLKDSIIAAGDYLMRQQLANGELSYQVDFLSGERAYAPSYVRLVGGTGSLFTVCRVSGNSKYCAAGDLALGHYLEFLITDSDGFTGTCLYTEGSCQLSGSALAVDTIYKRWQAAGNFSLNGDDLLNKAVELGHFILSMRNTQGGFYQSFDPHFSGTTDPDYFSAFSQSQSLLSLLEIYEMTGDDFWLEQALEVNAYLVAQPVTEDYWHGHALALLARLDKLTKADREYAVEIANTIIDGQVRSLDPANTSISTSTKIEALASLAKALYLSGADHKWLDSQIGAFVTFVQARQLPDNNCNWEVSTDMAARYGGGIFSSCDDSSIRVDALQHWVNGAAAFLEYRSIIKMK